MNLFSLLGNKTTSSTQRGVIDYGRQKKDGSHDHRHNQGEDRTQAQKSGDEKRRKP